MWCTRPLCACASERALRQNACCVLGALPISLRSVVCWLQGTWGVRFRDRGRFLVLRCLWRLRRAAVHVGGLLLRRGARRRRRPVLLVLLRPRIGGGRAVLLRPASLYPSKRVGERERERERGRQKRKALRRL